MVPIVLAVMAGMQVIGGMQQAENIRRQGKLTKRISEMNASYADQDAFNARADGGTQLADYQSDLDQVAADQRVVLAANNVDRSFGSAAEIVAESNLTGFLNKTVIMNQAHQKALGFEREARQIRLNGYMGQVQVAASASAAESAGMMKGISTFASGYAPTAPSTGVGVKSAGAPGELYGSQGSALSTGNKSFNYLTPG